MLDFNHCWDYIRLRVGICVCAGVMWFIRIPNFLQGAMVKFGIKLYITGKVYSSICINSDLWFLSVFQWDSCFCMVSLRTPTSACAPARLFILIDNINDQRCRVTLLTFLPASGYSSRSSAVTLIDTITTNCQALTTQRYPDLQLWPWSIILTTNDQALIAQYVKPHTQTIFPFYPIYK